MWVKTVAIDETLDAIAVGKDIVGIWILTSGVVLLINYLVTIHADPNQLARVGEPTVIGFAVHSTPVQHLGGFLFCVIGITLIVQNITFVINPVHVLTIPF